MSEYVLALDQGTTSSRAILFDASGAPVATAQREFEQLFPRPGWVEHRPEDLWASQVGVAAEALSRAGVSPNRVAALGITNQRETTLVWEKATGRPLGNAIVWQDRRTAGFCDELKARGLEPLFRERTGLVLDAYFSGTKVRWILDNVDGARAAAERGQLAFGTVDTWLVWHLTGGKVHATDASNAARTLMYDIRTGDWDDELLAALDVPRSMLPEVRDSSGDFGETAPGLLSAAVPVRGVAGDQQAALFGQACTRPGMVKNTYGTGCFMLLNTGAAPVPSSNQLLTTVAWRLKGKTTYALEGSVFIAGAVVQWLRDGLGLIRSAAEVEALAASVPDNGGVYLVPAFAGLGAPHWDPYARGVLAGITRGVTAGHLARAALEGVAFQAADVIEAMAADTGAPVAELRVDGGACANNLLMQFQADVLGAPLTRPRVIETTALGAAYLAGLGAGFWDGPDDISGQWREDRRFLPQTDGAGRAAMKQGWKKALERAKGWANA
ncbi:MAG: glycerol kinase GlpK [Candidatus Hydrogenedentes bacterium]|nr:glycerol kinase GlpK [Candidatus Hydrogenedentota bacterium]